MPREVQPSASSCELLDAIDWYRRCLEDIQDGRAVTGLREAKLAYDAALDQLREQASVIDVIFAKATEALQVGEADVSALWLRDTIGGA